MIVQLRTDLMEGNFCALDLMEREAGMSREDKAILIEQMKRSMKSELSGREESLAMQEALDLAKAKAAEQHSKRTAVPVAAAAAATPMAPRGSRGIVAIGAKGKGEGVKDKKKVKTEAEEQKSEEDDNAAPAADQKKPRTRALADSMMDGLRSFARDSAEDELKRVKTNSANWVRSGGRAAAKMALKTFGGPVGSIIASAL